MALPEGMGMHEGAPGARGAPDMDGRPLGGVGRPEPETEGGDGRPDLDGGEGRPEAPETDGGEGMPEGGEGMADPLIDGGATMEPGPHIGIGGPIGGIGAPEPDGLGGAEGAPSETERRASEGLTTLGADAGAESMLAAEGMLIADGATGALIEARAGMPEAAAGPAAAMSLKLPEMVPAVVLIAT